MTSTISAVHDVVGIGIGPSNLSVAALLDGLPDISAVFFERSDTFAWHPGLMFRDALLQTSFLKDLVTFADPTSPHSFINFLHATRRLHQFINADFERATRSEFSEYMAWVAARLPHLRFGREVRELRLQNDMFVARIDPNVEVCSRHVIVGVGRRPHVPACATAHLGHSVFHAGAFLHRVPPIPRGAVTIVGGGQSAAEIFLHFIRNAGELTAITWVTRRDNFAPLDETPFTNDYFTPLYARYFFDLDLERRLELIAAQKLASDGISPSTLREIYQEIYRSRYVEKRGLVLNLFVEHELVGLDRAGRGWEATIADARSGTRRPVRSDLVVLATGYDNGLPPALDGLRHLLEFEGDMPRLRSDFSAAWRVPSRNRLYLQNAGRRSHGIADPNLSLLAWRSATIVNSLVGYERFHLPQNEELIHRMPAPLHAVGHPSAHQPLEQIA